MKILVFALCVVVGGYVISEIVGYNDPSLDNPFQGLTLQEIDQDLPVLAVASGDTPALMDDPPFERMAVEERTHPRVGSF